MGREVKFKAGDKIGKAQILMVSDSWLPEHNKAPHARKAIFKCKCCDITFEASIDYIRKHSESIVSVCRKDVVIYDYKVGDKIGEQQVEILEVPSVETDKKDRKFKFKCVSCGRPFFSTVPNLKRTSGTCGCTTRRGVIYDGDISNGFEVLKANLYTSKSLMLRSIFKCKHCGKPFEASNSSIRSGIVQSCGCLRMTSKGETGLLNFISSIFPEYTPKKAPRLLGLKEIDIYIEELNLGFEYNGLYWHSEGFGKDQYYHINKTDMASQINIKLFHIYEHHWRHREHIVKDYLIKALHKQDFTVVHSDVIIKSVTQKEAKDFMKENSLYPYNPSEINLGLFIVNELVSLMSFQMDTLSINEYEVRNITSKVGINLESGFKKLLEVFEKDYQPKSLTCLSDNGLPIDYLLKDLDFNFHKRVLAKSYYFNPSNLEILTKQKVSALLRDTAESLSEYERITDYGYLKYWDCGNDMYIKLKGKI